MHYLPHFKRDKKIYKIISGHEEWVLEHRKNIHLYLCKAIISQQLSTKVANVIYKRFLALFGKKTPTAKAIIAIPFEDLRSIGLSNAKAGYVQNVCNFFIENRCTDARIQQMEDEELITFLTQIKGIGRWTTEMILMFSLGREDVFAVDDLGIQQAMVKLYKINGANQKEIKSQMITIAKKWKPYRTYACRSLWAWLDDNKQAAKPA